jgi:RNase P subunit RPR2
MAAKLKIEKRGDEILIVHCCFSVSQNAIFYQNMPNLHNRYISAERKISQKNTEYIYAKLLLAM